MAPTAPHRELVERLEHAFTELRGAPYRFDGGRDGKAVAALVPQGADEVERRWRMALAEQGYRRCDFIHELERKWNAYVGSTASSRGPQAPSLFNDALPRRVLSHELRRGRVRVTGGGI
jgi:hypothetical protein